MKKLFMVCVAALALSACGLKTNQNQATEEAAATTECCEQHAADATCEEGEACCGNKEVCDLEKAYNDLKALGDKLTDAQKEEMAKLEKAIEDAKAKAAEAAANAEAKVEEVKEAAEGVKDALKNLK